MCKVYKPCSKDAVCQISEYLDCQFMRRTFSKIHQILPFFAPYGGLNRCQPLDLHTLESPFPKDASYQIWFKSVQWFWRVCILNVFPYISLCKMKRPLRWGHFWADLIFTRTLYSPCLKDASYEFLYIWNIGSREEEFYMYFPI